MEFIMDRSGNLVNLRNVVRIHHQHNEIYRIYMVDGYDTLVDWQDIKHLAKR